MQILDNLKQHRREIWIDLEGQRVMFGWCHVNALKSSLPTYWHSENPFGFYAKAK